MGRFTLVKDLVRLTYRRRLWFFVPLFALIVFAGFLLVVLQTPALMPFFYAIF